MLKILQVLCQQICDKQKQRVSLLAPPVLSENRTSLVLKMCNFELVWLPLADRHVLRILISKYVGNGRNANHLLLARSPGLEAEVR